MVLNTDSQVPYVGGERGGLVKLSYLRLCARGAGRQPLTHSHSPTCLLTRSPLSSQDVASPKFSMPSPVRTVIAADFDNDQELEIFFNNFAHRSSSANRLFR